MAIYETIFILDSLVPSKEIDAIIDRAKSIITADEGTVRKVDKWGKKRMAYEIQKKQYGFYVSIEFESNGGNISQKLTSDYNYNDKVLRYLTYSYDKRKLKMLAKNAELDAESKGSENPVVEPVNETVELATDVPKTTETEKETVE
jgi:small subunit ribosomal protein S6